MGPGLAWAAGGLGAGILGSVFGKKTKYPTYKPGPEYEEYQFGAYEPGAAETMGVEKLMGAVRGGYDPSRLMSPEVVERLMPSYEAAMEKAMVPYGKMKAGLMEQLNLGGTLYSPGARAEVGERVGRPMAQELTGIMAGLPREAFGMGMQMEQVKRGDLASLMGYGQQLYGRDWARQVGQAGERQFGYQAGQRERELAYGGKVGQYGAQEQRAGDIQKLFGGVGAGMVEYGLGQALPQPNYEDMFRNLFRQHGQGGVSPWGGQ